MNRREVLKNLGLSTGFLVASPSILTLLQSCKTEIQHWQPTFLAEDHGIILKGLVDVFIPPSDENPSGNQVNVSEFIDKYVDEVYMVEEQEEFKKGMDALAQHIKSGYNESLDELTVENYMQLLDKDMQFGGEGSIVSDILNRLRNMTINAYRISEQVGENVLAYDPIPGAYYCGDLQELTNGKSWSL